MKKKTLILFLFLLSGLPLVSVAQNCQKHDNERIQAMRIGFYTDLLRLTPDEATKFWPVFNAYGEKRMDWEHKRRKIYNFIKKNKTIDDQTAKEKLKELEEIMAQIRELQNQYFQKFSKILRPSQLLKLRAAEFEFNRFLLHKFKKRKERLQLRGNDR